MSQFSKKKLTLQYATIKVSKGNILKLHYGKEQLEQTFHASDYNKIIIICKLNNNKEYKILLILLSEESPWFEEPTETIAPLGPSVELEHNFVRLS